MPLALLVPVHLDALHVTTPEPAVAPTLAFERLPTHVDGRAKNADVPYLGSALAQWARRKLEPGVHLHWSLPDALTRERAEGGFRALPNRWVVRRDGGELAMRTWLVESDVVRFGAHRPGPAARILWGQGDRAAWLGRTTVLAADEAPPEDAGDDRLEPLTVDISGEITFAALYSRCAGVFGLHDPEIGAEVPRGLRYLLYGFHVRPKEDPVLQAGPALLEAELRWRTDDGLGVEAVRRSVYYAVVDFPDGTPAPAPDEPHPVDVALGTTTEEALGALEAEHDPLLEEAVASMLFLAESPHTETDLQAALAEHRHTSGFHATVGESRWVLRRLPGQDSTAEGDDHALVAAFRELVDVQRLYDVALRQIRSLREQLFGDWCRYLLCAYPREGTRLGDLPDLDDVREYVEASLLDPLDRLAERTGRVEWRTVGDHRPVQPRVDPARRGELAHRLVAAWQAMEALLGDGGTRRYELVLAPGARHFAPRELSVVIRGEAVGPSVRHGMDGRLDDAGRLVCPTAQLQRPSASRDARREVFALLDGWFDHWVTDETPAIGFSRARREPWHPLVLDWSVDYEAVAHELPYPAGFLIENFHHDPQRPDLVPSSENLERGSPLPLTGWSVLTRGAQRTVSSLIRGYIAELKQHAAEPPPVVERLAALADRLESGPPVLSCTLNGLDDALVGKRRSPQLPVRDPLALPGSIYESLAERVASWVGAGNLPGAAPDPGLDLHPLRTGFLRLDELRVIGNFGTVRRLKFDHVRLPPTFPEIVGDEHAFLPPRILAPSRLRFRWLDASAAGREATDHPSTGPVHGWLVIDRLDSRILAFDGEGSRLGALEVDADRVVWTPARAPVASAVMVEVLERLRTGTADSFDAFVQAMLDGQELIDPIGAAHHRSLALLASRPVAVTRALVDIELAGHPPRSSSWSAFRHTLVGGDDASPDRAGLGGVAVSVRLGTPLPEGGVPVRLDDGLLGFWVDGDAVMHAPKSPPASDASPHVLVRTGTEPVGVTMLVDPRGQVHAISGVLPTKRLAIDSAQVAPALAALQVSFRAGPILTRPGFVDHVEPTGPDLRWRWVDDDGSPDEQAIEPLRSQSPVPAALELREGFLRLSRGPRN